MATLSTIFVDFYFLHIVQALQCAARHLKFLAYSPIKPTFSYFNSCLLAKSFNECLNPNEGKSVLKKTNVTNTNIKNVKSLQYNP